MLGWKDVSKVPFQILTQFEMIQLEWLVQWKNKEHLGVLLREYKDVYEHMVLKAPKLKESLQEILKQKNDLVYTKQLEADFMSNLEDWIVYLIDPDCYDQQTHNSWDDEELLSLTDFHGKTVIDIGSGTGSQVFRMAPLAKTIYCVEPVGQLRGYIKDKAKTLGYEHLYVVDGLMTDLPYPDGFAEIITSGHVFGDDMEREYEEMNRVLKKGGMFILIPGNNDVDNDVHKFLVKKGFSYQAFLEPGDGMKRKYWKTK